MSKVMFSVPPINDKRGQAQATQGRQYQFFKDPTFIYPIIPAIFATMLITEKQEFLWIDSVAEELSDVEFSNILIQMKPDYLVFEANTMLINRYIEVINGIKKNLPDIKIVLCGEHVTACPEEVKSKCQADYFIQGGKWYYDVFKIITGKEWGADRPLPHIDRDSSRWWLYAYKNGNFKYVPATYTMAAQDCWYRPKQACTFCTWVSYHPENKVRPVEDFLQEVEGLINMGFKEFFDDSGTFPVGEWFHVFCQEMIDRGYNKYIKWGCNMRFKGLQPADFKLMSDAGCRFILWGYESGNQSTLDKLSKGYTLADMKRSLTSSHLAGIWNHLTVMTGYPWEELYDEYNTYKTVRWLLLKGIASSMQSTVFMPYPGTKAFKDCKEQGLILTEDWDKWTMLEPVVKLRYDFKEVLKLQRKYYEISYHPIFLFRKIMGIRSIDDLKFYLRLSRKVIDRFTGLHQPQEVML